MYVCIAKGLGAEGAHIRHERMTLGLTLVRFPHGRPWYKCA